MNDIRPFCLDNKHRFSSGGSITLQRAGRLVIKQCNNCLAVQVSGNYYIYNSETQMCDTKEFGPMVVFDNHSVNLSEK